MCPDVVGWSVTELVGSGGFAAVWRATRLADGVTAVLKIAHARGSRFDREAAMMRRLGPGCTPALLEIATTVDGRSVLAMEHVGGQSLDSLADRPAAIHALAVALVELHRAGVAHLDIKPANVIVANGRAVLIDLGLARHADLGPAIDTVDAAGLRAGTVRYMAPEQCRGDRDIGTAADIYAFGTIVHELIAGRPPFTGNAFDVEQAHLEQRPPKVGCDDERLEQLVAACLAKRAAMRPTAAAVLAALDEIERTPWTVHAIAPGRTASRSRRDVALLGAPNSEDLAAAVAAAGGAIARVVDQRVIVAFPAAATPTEGISRARSLARSLGAGVRIHVGELVVRGSATGTMLAGRALDDIDSWWNDAPIYAATPAAPASTHPLIGRAELLAELERRGALVVNGPVLDLVIGERGHGKTAVLRAAAAAARKTTVVEVAGGSGMRLVCALRDAGLLDDLLGPTIRIATDRETLYAALAAVIPEQAFAAATAIHEAPPPHGWAAATCRTIASRALARLLRIAASTREFALVVDDLDRAELVVIDAIELAVLPGTMPLWIVAAVDAAWRSQWGAAAAQLQTHAVGALLGVELAALWRSLIAPVEFVPDAVIDRLAALSGGVPHHAVELASALRSSGALAIVDGVATLTSDELLFASSTPLFERLAARTLATLPPDLAEAARACAVLDDAISVEALNAITPTGLDAVTAIERLVDAGLLHALRFRSPPLRAAIELAIPAEVREQLHAAALAWGHANGERPAWLAHHATNAHQLDANDHWLAAADVARLDHDDVEAERCYGMVLASPSTQRARALAGRGRVRVRLQRTRDAIADLDEALGATDGVTAIEVMLDLATALDWADEHDRSEALARRALDHARSANEPRLVAAALSAVGRSHWRHERLDDAIAACELALHGDDDTRINTLTLLAPALAIAGRLDDSWRAFTDLEAACHARDDRFHLGVCFGNRLQYWSQRGSIEPALDDLRRSIALAREVGHFKLERVALHSLAELLHWTGDDAEAEPLARRARELQLRYLERHVPEDVLLLGRILAARDRRHEAAELVDSLRRTSERELVRTRSRQLLASLVELATAHSFDSAAWTALIDSIAGELPIDEQLESLWFAIRRAPSPEPWRQRALELSRSLPSWRVRFVSPV